MKVLIVCSYKAGFIGNVAPFIQEQVESLKDEGLIVEYFLVRGKGIKGYLSCLPAFRKKIKEYKPDIIHSHFGLCGLFANIQRKIPVITTYHGCDVQALGINLLLSRISMFLSSHNIFVSSRMLNISAYKRKNCSVVPCGIKMEDFTPYSLEEARRILNWDKNETIIQFAGSFNSSVKNFTLAKQAINIITKCSVKELSNLSREQVNLYLCAANCVLLTSIREGSPMIIKEAMACGCPIVSTDVGDVRMLLENSEGAYIVKDYNALSIARAVQNALNFNGRTNGRKKLIDMGLTTHDIALKVINIYKSVLK